MKRFILAAFAAVFCFALLAMGAANAQTISPLVNQTTPFRDPSVTGDVVYYTGDELATLLVFDGTRRITNVTFKYTSLVPVNYTVRFYRLPPPILPQVSFIGPLVKTVTFTNLPAGRNVVTRELTPEQQFDWASVLNFNGGFAGGFYSVQLTRTDGSDTGRDAGHPLATPGPFAWSNLTRGGAEDPVSLGLIPFRPEFEDFGFPSVGFFINISGVEIPAPAPVRVSSLQLTTNTVVGGVSLTGTVNMTDTTLEDTTVTINARGAVQAPSTVTVPAGAQSVSFPITTTAVDGNGSYAVQATYAGKTVQQFLVVTPANATLTALTLSANSVRGGTGLRGVITLSGPFEQDRTVTISNSSNGSVAQTPTTVTVPAGAQFVSFPITTSAVSSNRSVVIRATFAGKTVEQTLTATRRR